MKILFQSAMLMIAMVGWLAIDRNLSKAGESPFVMETPYSIQQLEWSPQSDILASSYWGSGRPADTQITLWDVITGESIDTIQPSGGSRLEAFAWSPDGQSLASRHSNFEMPIWNVDGKEVVASVGLDDFLTRDFTIPIFGGLDFSPNGAYLAGIEDRFVNIWNLNEDSVLNVNVMNMLEQAYEIAGLTYWSSSLGDVEWSPDGSRLAVSSRGGELLILSEIGNMLAVSPSPLSQQSPGWSQPSMLHSSQHLSWSSDGSKIVSYFTKSSYEIFSIYVWNGHTAELLSTVDLMGPYEISAIAWNPVHDAIAIACSDGLIRILDADTLEISQALEGHTDEVNTVTWSPDGTRLASGSMDKTIRIWDIPQAE